MSGSIDLSSTSDDVRLLVDLVSTPSVSGSERAASEVFIRHASVLGFDAEIDEANNALAHRGASSADARTHIALLGHIDTVPGQIPVRIIDGELHGRGSVDAKGPLAAMLVGASRVGLPEGVRLTVVGAVGEEIAGSPGARHLAPRLRPDACIIGEPSGWDGVTLGYKGRLLATATATVPNSHSAGRAPSAGDEITRWWASVTGHADRFNAGRTHAFDIIQCTIQDMRFECDGLEQHATFEAVFRLPLNKHPDAFAAELQMLASEPVRVDCSGSEVAHATDRNDPVVRALSAAIRGRGGQPHPKLKTGTADLNVVGPIWDCPIAAYGPGDSSLDHTPFERLPLHEYTRSIDVLQRALETLAAELAISSTPAPAGAA